MNRFNFSRGPASAPSDKRPGSHTETRRDSRKLLVAGALLGAALPVCQAAAQESAATEQLRGWSSIVTRQVFEVADNVYTAVGITLSANSMIVGDDGVIIVDPGHSPTLSAEVRREFEQITDKPIRAIIFTHGHGDHFRGASAFADEGSDIEVWARANFGSEVRAAAEAGFVSGGAGLSGGVRPADTQGGDLPPEQTVQFNGPPRPMSPEERATPVRRVPPTHTFSEERIELEIAGVELELVAAPGEAADHLYIWLPEERVLFAGDNVFHTWPNVYPLRGTNRSIRDWIASLDKMIAEDPVRVVAGHGNPLLENAVEQLTNRRDAMQWVYDRTIEGAMLFMTPDELVEYAALPEQFASLDYLADYYGSVWGTIRQIYAQEIGWFDGDPLNLHRESPVRQSARMAELVGGVDALFARAQEAMAAGDPLGAAQLAQHLTRLRPDDPGPKLLLADALDALGEQTLNAPARHYSFSYANLLRREAGQQ